jgi:hypothetical protein
MNIDPIIDEALQTVRPKPPKKTLSELIAEVEEIEQSFSDMEEISQEVVREHFEAITAVDEKTDKMIAFIERMRMESAAASEKAEAYKSKSKILENAAERCCEYAKFLLKMHPDLEYRGKKGKFALQRIAPKLVITTPQHRFSSDKVIPDDQLFAIPEEFREVKVIWTYNTKKIKDTLQAGTQTPIARLDENVSLRIKLI